LAASLRTFSAITEKKGFPSVSTEKPIVPLLLEESPPEVVSSPPPPHPEKVRQRKMTLRVKVEKRARFMNSEDLG
jgi:hypothetical protein